MAFLTKKQQGTKEIFYELFFVQRTDWIFPLCYGLCSVNFRTQIIYQ